MDYETCFDEYVRDVKSQGRYRTFATMERIVGKAPKALCDGKWVTVWCSNDYLSMGTHPSVISAAKAALEKSGAGAGGTRNISGTTRYHVELEAKMASLHGKQAALVFSSGYVANQGALASLGKILPNCIIFSDACNHASMIHGIRDSGVDKKIYRHSDMDHLEELLRNAPANASKIIACESVYSMDGDIAPLHEVVRLAKKYGALTYVDEVHAVGIYGKTGAGIIQEMGLVGEIDVIEGTFGKAYGAMGGYIAASALLVDAVRCASSSFIFTTALPPAALAGAIAAVSHLEESDAERKAIKRNAQHLKERLRASALPFLDGISHIVPLIVGEPNCCREVCARLFKEYEIYVQPINYPTVPKGTERLRLTASASHTLKDVDNLADALERLWQSEHLPKRTFTYSKP